MVERRVEEQPKMQQRKKLQKAPEESAVSKEKTQNDEREQIFEIVCDSLTEVRDNSPLHFGSPQGTWKVDTVSKSEVCLS